MRFQILGVAAVGCIAFIAACGSDATPTNTPPPSSTAGAASLPPVTAGAGGSAPTTGAGGGAPVAGAPTVAGAGGSAEAGGAGGAGGGAPAAGGAGVGGSGAAGAAAGGTSNYGGVVGLEDLSTIKPSPGCNMADPATKYPGIQANNTWQPQDKHDYKSGYIIQVPTPADHPVASIAGKVLDRRYFLKLPTGYDKTHPYKLLFQGAGCSGKGTDVTPFETVTNGKAIFIALEIYPGVWGGGSGPDGGVNAPNGVSCFDDKRGEKTIEKPFIEGLYAKLRTELCFDEHRVFIAGHSSGGWLSNQLGNAYGSKIMRAISPSSGGLALGEQQQPSDNLPVSGIWWHQPNDGTNPFQGTRDAINHALKVNKCTDTSLDTAASVDATYPGVTICKKLTSCPPQFPITICRPAGNDHSNNHDVNANRAATWAFFDAF